MEFQRPMAGGGAAARAKRRSRVAATLVVPLLVAVLAAGGTVAAHAQGAFVARIEGGALSPDSPFRTSLAVGGAVGLAWRTGVFLLRAVRESETFNHGADLAHGRTYVLADWEMVSRPSGWRRQRFLFRVGAGWVHRPAPLRSTWAADLAVGASYRLVPRLDVLATLEDLIADLPAQTLLDCTSSPACAPYRTRAELQHNVGLLVGLELRP